MAGNFVRKINNAQQAASDNIAKAQDAGMHVLGAICLVDRQQGATEMLAGKGIVLEHVFTLSELVAHNDGLQARAGVK